MGVPKLFRWLTDRYPLIAQTGLGVTLRSSGILPPIDDLFIDANSIIHSCTHPEYGSAPKTEAEMFRRIGVELDTMVSIVAPRRTFFVAVDGVAPRAKLNQQRSRRFRSALASETPEKISDGTFDPNAITPGTPFMARLSAFLRSFLQSRATTEHIYPPKVIYSGQEIPGEGEHKILDEIRSLSKRKALGATCVHGLDADLIMLALASQHRSFVLLREQRPMAWEKKKRNPATLPKQLGEMMFDVLHISILRDYLKMELGASTQEEVIADFVLLSMLAGNDFLPHVPGCHIDKQSLDALLSAYVKVRKPKEFLTSPSTPENPINWFLLARILQACNFPSSAVLESSSSDTSVSSSDQLETEVTLEKNPEVDPVGFGENGSETDTQDYSTYYARKFSMELGKGTAIEPIVASYLRTLLWAFHYYYQGLVSWSVYYPYHYAPLAMDIYEFLKSKNYNLDISFQLGTPLRPLEQLLAVLPATSGRKLLPPILYELMLMEGPLGTWYPSTFSIDFNEKQRDWEAVVLIPFIDEEMLLTAVRRVESKLTPEERALNLMKKTPFVWNIPEKLKRKRQELFSWKLGPDCWWPSLTNFPHIKRSSWVKGRRSALSRSFQIELNEGKCARCLLPQFFANALFANWPYCPLQLGHKSSYLQCLGITNGEEIMYFEKEKTLQKRQMTGDEKTLFLNSLMALKQSRDVALMLPEGSWYFFGRIQGPSSYLLVNGVRLKSGRDLFLIPPALLWDTSHSKGKCIHNCKSAPSAKKNDNAKKNNIFTTSPFEYFVKASVQETPPAAIDASQLEMKLLGLESCPESRDPITSDINILTQRLKSDLGIARK